MGDWYVIANIPTFIEKSAFNAVESYRLNEDGTVATTFRFREGSFKGEEKIYRPTGFIVDKKSNAVWGMQFLWPIKTDYRIAFVLKTTAGPLSDGTSGITSGSWHALPHIPDEELSIIAQKGFGTRVRHLGNTKSSTGLEDSQLNQKEKLRYPWKRQQRPHSRAGIR